MSENTAVDLHDYEILLSAFACDPQHGSERYVGWRWLKMLADQFGKVYVLTREFNRPYHMAQSIPENVEFIYFDLPFGGRLIHHRAKLIKPYYVFWQIAASLRLNSLVNLKQIAIIHHVTYNVVDIPGFLWRFGNQIFVWGPVGGGQVPPRSLKSVFGRLGWIKERTRGLMKSLVRYNPAVRAAAKRSRVVLFANYDTARLLDKVVSHREMMLETAIDRDQIVDTDRIYPTGETFDLTWLANFEENKAFPIALDALQMAQARVEKRLFLHVIGDGSARKSQEMRVARSRLRDQVHFHGRIPFGEVGSRMRSSGAFLFTSVRDTSGNVVLEAMAAGTPVIGLKHQGVEQMLRHGGGILVEIGTYEETVRRYADAIVRLVEDPELWRRKSDEAREQIETRLNWDAKSERIASIYASLLIELPPMAVKT